MNLKMRVYNQDEETGTYGVDLLGVIPLKYQSIKWDDLQDFEKMFEGNVSKVLETLEQNFSSDTIIRKPSGTNVYCNKKEINLSREALISFWYGDDIEIFGHFQNAAKSGHFELEMK